MNRRQLFYSTGMGFMGAVAARAGVTPRLEKDGKNRSEALSLVDYQPHSMLQVPENHVARARYPVIDIHTHITGSVRSKNGVELAAARDYYAKPAQLLAVMDRKNMAAMVNLTGGYGSGLADTVKAYDRAFPDRFYTLTEPTYEKFLEPNYPELQAQAIEQAHRDGARGGCRGQRDGGRGGGRHRCGLQKLAAVHFSLPFISVCGRPPAVWSNRHRSGRRCAPSESGGWWRR